MSDPSGLETAEFLVAALFNMPTGILIVERPTGRPILANRCFRELLGASAATDAEIASVHIAGAFTREDGSPFAADELPLRRTLADGQPHGASDIWLERPDGVRIALAARSARISHQRRDAAVLVIQDVSALRGEERQRRTAEILYRDLFDQATDGILVVTRDNSTTIVDANPAGEKLYGYDRGELSGLEAGKLSPPKQADGRASQPSFLESVKLARGDEAVRFPWRGRRKGGGLIELEMTVQPLRLEDSPDLLLIQARDVTRQRILEEDLRQAQKLEAIGVLAGGLAHDYNNLLTGVIGFTDLALDQLPTTGDEVTERVRHFLTQANRCSHRSSDLTRQLLTLSRRSRPASELLDLNATIERSLPMIQRLVGETITLRVVLAPEGCAIRGDGSEIEQVLINLAIHARDAMRRSGSVRIETKRYTADGASEDTLGLEAGEYVVLVVSDDGAEATDQVRVVEPYLTTRAGGHHAGIGLAVVNTVVERHGGRIFVDSRQADGCCRFTIALPCVTTEALPRASPMDGAVPHGTGSLLVVDDDGDVRDVTAILLERLGYTVTKARGGTEALELAARAKFDLVISDVVMPRMTGIELKRRLRLAHPSLRVLLVSGYADEAFAQDGVEASDSTALLRKPLSLESLARKVDELLREGTVPCRAGA